jgi:HAD superfamily hydrolase (TIGR01490 family)
VNSAETIGAFFDLDGTLLPPPSLEWRFIAFLLARDELGGAACVRWLAHFAKSVLRDPSAATDANKMYVAGLRQSLAADWEDSLALRPVPLFAGAMERVTWHAAQGHLIFVVSGTLEPFARAVARGIPRCVEVCASALEARDGHWTGRLASEHVSGEAKERAVRRLAARYAIELGRSYAYGNCLADVPMLRSIGNPVAVNPGMRLGRIARRRGWQACEWKELLATAPGARVPKFSTGEAR